MKTKRRAIILLAALAVTVTPSTPLARAESKRRITWVKSRTFRIKWIDEGGRPVYVGAFSRKGRRPPPKGLGAVEIFESFRDRFVAEAFTDFRAWRSDDDRPRRVRRLLKSLDLACEAWERVAGKGHRSGQASRPLAALVDRARLGAIPSLVALVGLTGDRTGRTGLKRVQSLCTDLEFTAPTSIALDLLEDGGLPALLGAASPKRKRVQEKMADLGRWVCDLDDLNLDQRPSR